MFIIRRLKEIAGGVRWAFRFDNPIEVLTMRHVFRHKHAVVVECAGMLMLIDTECSDVTAVDEVLFDGVYDEAILTAGTGRRNFRYLNLGANIGTFDVRVFQLLRRKCESVGGTAIEMNPANHARLLLNLELNRLSSVHAINAAAWSEPGIARIPLEERDTGQRCADQTEVAGYPVRLLPWRELFDQVAALGNLDLIKIDIEGAEERVVPQITEDDAGRTRYLIIETHSPEVHQQVSEHLRAIGFRENHQEQGAGQCCLTSWQGAAAQERHASPTL